MQYRRKGCAVVQGAKLGGGAPKSTLTQSFNGFAITSVICSSSHLEFWSRLLSVIDKVSKSLQSEEISTTTAAGMLRLLNMAIQSMWNTGIDEITARDTDNVKKMDVLNQFPEKRNRRVRRLPSEQRRERDVWGQSRLPSEQANNEGVCLSPQQKFGNDC